MKLATWNVNSLVARLQHVLDWLAANPVDVLCLQELKMSDDKFPLEVLKDAGYDSAVFGQKTYNGVAILSRAPVRDVLKNIGGFADDHSRVISGTLDTPAGALRIVNGYFVNGQAPGSEKFAYKMKLARRPARLAAPGTGGPSEPGPARRFQRRPRRPRQLRPGRPRRDHPPHAPRSASTSRRCCNSAWRTASGCSSSRAKSYSWWDYRMLGYQKNRGLRIDHVLVSEPLVPRVKSCAIDRVPRKWEKPSDHAPRDPWSSAP